MSDLRPPRNAPATDPSRRPAGEKPRRQQIAARLQAAGASNVRQAVRSDKEKAPAVRFAVATQRGKKQPKVATPELIHVSFGAITKIVNELESKDKWCQVVSTVMKDGKKNEALRNNFRRYTAAIGQNPKQLVDAIGPDGHAAYKSIWQDAADQHAFANLVDGLSRLFQTQIGNHERLRLSEVGATQSMAPIVVLDLGDPMGYQSSQPFTDADISQVADLDDELTALFAAFRKLKPRAVLPELAPVANTSGTSRADEGPPHATTSAVNAEQQAARRRGTRHFTSVRLLGAKWKSMISGALSKGVTQDTPGTRVEPVKTPQA